MIQTQIIYCGDNLQKLKELPNPGRPPRDRPIQGRHAPPGTRQGRLPTPRFSADAKKEIDRVFNHGDLHIVPLTVEEILSDEVRMRL
jgi:hypothetical protein